MKSVVILRFFLTLALAFCISSTQLFSQEDTEKKEETEEKEPETPPQRGQRGGGGGGQRGQGGQGGQRGQGQRGGLPDMSSLSKEERMARLNEIIQKNVVEMEDVVEIRDDQQEAFVKSQAAFEVEMIKIQGQMQSVGQDRNKRRALGQSRTKASSDTSKAMKKILDKDQMKSYTAKMKERMSQQGQRGGRRR
jgi:hypothetical protein